MGEFKEQRLDPKELVNAILKDLEKDLEKFSSSEEAVDWLNNSILPYKLLSNSELSKDIQKLLGQVEKDKGKKLIQWTDEELEKLANTPEGRRLKRLTLRLHYPLKAPKSQKN